MAQLTEEYVKNIVEEKGYTFISMEKKKDKKGRKVLYVLTICPNGHKCERNWNSLRDGSKCGYCAKNKKFTIEEVREYIESFGYELLSDEYLGKDHDLTYKCDKGHEYTTAYNVFRRGFRCPTCSGNKKYTLEEINTIVSKEGYKLLSTEYKNANDDITLQCPKNHKPYDVRFSDFKNNNRRCPYCNESRGEKEITKVLTEMRISYVAQYKFDDCRSIRRLPFDFYLPDYNILVEFDGEGHYRMVNWKGNKDIAFDTFVGTVIRDTIKNEYCKKNNIELIRIPYWEFDNIEKILKENIK